MRTTKNVTRHAYSVDECQAIMTQLSGSPTIGSPFPNLPVEIQFQNGSVMKVREVENPIGVDDELCECERQFVIRMEGILLE